MNPIENIFFGVGVTGLGTAVDATSRGFKTLLLEQSDFAKSTSSRSTKLVHGGVRYLSQGDVLTAREALERGRMKQNCPHLVRDMCFIIGNYRWWEHPYYTVGLIFYDISKREFFQNCPTNPKQPQPSNFSRYFPLSPLNSRSNPIFPQSPYLPTSPTEIATIPFNVKDSLEQTKPHN